MKNKIHFDKQKRKRYLKLVCKKMVRKCLLQNNKINNKMNIANNLGSRTQIKNYCVHSARSKGVHRCFRLSRILLRQYCSFGKIPGYTKRSW